MRLAVAAMLAVALQGCSGASADDAASGQEAAASPAANGGLISISEAPPADVDVSALEPLGDVADLDLGPRDGSCTFLNQGNALMLAGAPNDPATAGKGVIRAGGALYVLAAPRGGFAEIRDGTLFTGAGFSVRISPPRPKDSKTVIDIRTARGQTILPGEWNCA